MSKVQAILFDRSMYTFDDVRKFLIDHNFKPLKPVHATNKYFRARFLVPNKDLYYYRTKEVSPGIKVIFSFKK